MKQYQYITNPSVAKALTHPLRARILAALENRTASPSEIAEELDAPLGVVSYHVRRLHALKFLKLVKRVPRRGAVEHYYTTVAGPFVTNEAWSSTPTVVKHATVSATLGEIGAQASAAVNSGGFDYDNSHISRIPAAVDEQGWNAIGRELDATFERIKKIEAASQKRLLKADHVGERPAVVAMMLFSPLVEADSSSDRSDTPRARGRRKRPASTP